MMKTLILTAAVMAGLATSTSTAEAQSGFGIGFGGRGVGVYVGRGGGWGGYYGPSGYYGPGYNNGPRVYSGYGSYGPSYYGGTYYSSPYYAPGQAYSGSTVVTPAVPSGPAAPMFDGGTIVLMNPATNSDSVEYMLNGEQFVMRPGQSQRFAHDRDWVIEFARGDASNFVTYSLKSAAYKFKPTSQGWELFEQAESRPSPSALPPPPASKNPARPTDQVPPPAPEPDEPKPRELTSPSNVPETVIRSRTATKPGSSEKPGPQLTN